MYKIINFLILITFFVWIYFIGILELPETLGFGLGFVILGIFILCISFYKRLPITLLILASLTILGVIGFNHFLYYIIFHNLSFILLELMLTFTLGFFIFCFVGICLYPIHDLVYKFENMKRLSFLYPYFSLYSLIFFYFINFRLGEVLPTDYYFSFIILGWLIIAWGFISCLTRRVSDEELVQVILKEQEFKVIPIKKQIFIGYGIFILLCSFFECFRKLWWIWLEFLLLFFLMSMSAWKIWKPVFEKSDYNFQEISQEPKIPDFSQKKYALIPWILLMTYSMAILFF